MAGDEVTEAHLRHLRHRNLSPGTIDQRRRVLTRLHRHAGTHPKNATTAQLLAFRERLTRMGKPFDPASIAAELSHLTEFYRWLILEGLRDDDPTVRVPRPQVPRRLPRPISEHLLNRAVSTAPERVAPWLMLAAGAGLRACEIAPISASDLWWSHAPPVIEVRRGKGGNPRYVPIAPALAPVLRRLPHRGWLFERRDGNVGPTPPHIVSRLSNEHLARQGIPFTLHSLRHRFATQALRASGGDLRAVQELMGHASIASTTIYTEVEQDHLAAIVAALPVAV